MGFFPSGPDSRLPTSYSQLGTVVRKYSAVSESREKGLITKTRENTKTEELLDLNIPFVLSRFPRNNRGRRVFVMKLPSFSAWQAYVTELMNESTKGQSGIGNREGRAGVCSLPVPIPHCLFPTPERSST